MKMFKLLETIEFKTGEKKEFEREFHSRTHMLKSFKASGMPNSIVYKLKKLGECVVYTPDATSTLCVIEIENE